MNSNPRIAFFGTPQFAVTIAEGLIRRGYSPSLIITAPDRPAGRKQILAPPPVKVLAEQHHIPFAQPETLDDVSLREIWQRRTNLDLFVVAAYGKIIPKDILDIPHHGSINVHPSLLPKLRGPSPIQGAVLEAKEKTGITIMLMDEKMDHGPILAKAEYEIHDPKITTETLSKELAERGAKLLVETIPRYLTGEITPQEQEHGEATYTHIIKREDGHINWQENADAIERKTRAYTPWPSTYTYWHGKRLAILAGDAIANNEERPGTPYRLGDTFAIRAGEGSLVPTLLRLAGKTPVSAHVFLSGHPDIIGAELS